MMSNRGKSESQAVEIRLDESQVVKVRYVPPEAGTYSGKARSNFYYLEGGDDICR